MKRIRDLQFWKLFGSGTGEGFTPVPNTEVYAILAVWPSFDIAKSRLEDEGLFNRYRNKCAEHWTVFLQTSSVRGRWSDANPFEPGTATDDGPIAALTRATIKPSVALQFWKRVPAISTVIGSDSSVLFKIGVGEVPWFHQVTFSIWPDLTSMSHFARKDGPHARAIKAVRAGDWFSEELYARFAVREAVGSWQGKNPLAAFKPEEGGP
ncbi:hypothetical protein KIN_16770 [Litoreibacter roseus]|uniref:Spheroidene monooxygenase n=2 Tax=Litoreibacter roseus TaxID=2601869 RepID=A0A6N6JE33_9RHOB|nr:spheroidene monooxygenase [Litoreibacter roseus]GFE64603.1 hypothetical protein KIN_16770 [Litoreibacter roseus]